MSNQSPEIREQVDFLLDWMQDRIEDLLLEKMYDEAYDLYMEWHEWIEDANPHINTIRYEKK
tara:strand:- start:276 stop:461 length:186 start_codon:yes stop_codon:yes gene_type:complete